MLPRGRKNTVICSAHRSAIDGKEDLQRRDRIVSRQGLFFRE
jgi:hypothetical protein